MELVKRLNAILKEYSEGNKIIAYKKLKKVFQNNKHPKIRFNIAVMEQELGYYKLAKQNYIQLINDENHLPSMNNLYLLAIKNNSLKFALEIIEKILEIDKFNSKVLIDKAYIFYKIKNYRESINICNTILYKNKNEIRALNVLGLCYEAKGKINEAIKILNKAIEINKNDTGILNALGKLYNNKREFKKSEKYFLSALDLQSNDYLTLNNIAGLYIEEGRYKESLTYYKKAYKHQKNNEIILNNISKAYFNLDNIKSAEEFCLKAIKINPSNSEINKNFSLIKLKQNNFKEAWKYFDGRLGLSEFSLRNESLIRVQNKLLKGGKIDKNLKILVLREQGVGDEILYGTMYEDLITNYKNIKIECDERLFSLFKNSLDRKNNNIFIKYGNISNNLEKLKDYDNVIYAGSLGRFFRNSINSFPKKNYLTVDQTILKKINKKMNHLHKKFKIGISWKSFKNRYLKDKSVELDDLKNIFAIPNCDFINLQYGNIFDELKHYLQKNKTNIHTIKEVDLFNNLHEVSCILTNLDLFITVSNSTAHLAGALGVKTLLIKPYSHATFHYWNSNKNRTPWYNSIKIIEKLDLKFKETVLDELKS